MTFEGEQNKITREQVLEALKEGSQDVVSEYILRNQEHIDTIPDRIEAEYRRLEFSFELAKMYIEAGETVVGLDDLRDTHQAAEAGCYFELADEILTHMQTVAE